MKKIHLILFSLLCLCASCSSKSDEGKKDNIRMTLFQLNLWEECGNVPNAFDALVDQMVALQPDFATFCELYKSGNDAIVPKLLSALRDKGLTYYGKTIDGRAILSKYRFDDSQRINEWMFKAVFTVDGQRVAVYSSHSNYRYYACYLPRGYNDGGGEPENWSKLPAPVTNVAQILNNNRKSGRIESAQAFINNAKGEIAAGGVVLFAGDLNEPSHLDWQADTKDMFEHNGCIVDWDVSKLLYSAGYKDSYREMHPDPVACPGITWPADNKDVEVSELVWAAEADERDRIDFVYYYPKAGFSIVDAKLVGPSGTIARSERMNETTQDPTIAPAGNRWPSDHKGLLVTFDIAK